MSPRTHRSAKAAGTRQETIVAAYLAVALDDDRIERRARNGAKDRGDIGGVRTALGERVVLEVKNTSRLNLGPWWSEVEVEKGNDDAPVGAIVHKRHGKGQAADQWVTLTLADFARLLGATTPDEPTADEVRDDRELISDDRWEAMKEDRL